MIDGLILGALSWISAVFSFNHLPRRVQKGLLANRGVAAFLGTGLSFLALSGISHSLTAVVGSITCGLLIDATLFMVSEKG